MKDHPYIAQNLPHPHAPLPSIQNMHDHWPPRPDGPCAIHEIVGRYASALIIHQTKQGQTASKLGSNNRLGHENPWLKIIISLIINIFQ